jgi:hypothetical protein
VNVRLSVSYVYFEFRISFATLAMFAPVDPVDHGTKGPIRRLTRQWSDQSRGHAGFSKPPKSQRMNAAGAKGGLVSRALEAYRKRPLNLLNQQLKTVTHWIGSP